MNDIRKKLNNTIEKLYDNIRFFIKNVNIQDLKNCIAQHLIDNKIDKYENVWILCEALLDLVLYIRLRYKDFSPIILCNSITDELFTLQDNLLFIPQINIQAIYKSVNYLKKNDSHLFEIIKDFLECPYQEVFFPYQRKYYSIESIIKNFNQPPKEYYYQGKIWIIIPFYVSTWEKFLNRFKFLLDTVKSLRKQTNITYKLTIFCNQSTFSFAQIVKDSTKADYLLFSQENLWAATAKNKVWDNIKNECQKNDFILFLDDDIYFNDPWTLSHLANNLYINKEVSCVSPIIIHDNPQNRMLLQRGYEPLREFVTIKKLKPLFQVVCEEKNIKNLKPAYLLEWCCLLTRCEYFFSWFRFPDEYNYYYEETLLENQIYLQTKKACMVNQSSRVIHRKAWGGVMSPHTIYYFYRNLVYYLTDLDINIKSPIWKKILKRHLSYINDLISSEVDIKTQKTMKDRLELAKVDCKAFMSTNKKISKNNEYNIYWEIKSLWT